MVAAGPLDAEVSGAGLKADQIHMLMAAAGLLFFTAFAWSFYQDLGSTVVAQGPDEVFTDTRF